MVQAMVYICTYNLALYRSSIHPSIPPISLQLRGKNIVKHKNKQLASLDIREIEPERFFLPRRDTYLDLLHMSAYSEISLLN